MSQSPKPKWGDALPPGRADRVWQEIEEKLDAGPMRTRASQRRRPAIAFAAVASLAVAALLALWLRPSPLAVTVALPVPSGGVVVAETKLADGSKLEPAPGTRVEILRSTASEFATLQRRGRCRYEVTPGGPRKWTIETDLATVEVIGTVFTVERSDDGLTVEVERGRVFVRGGARAETLGPGDRLHLPPPVSEALSDERRERERDAHEPPDAGALSPPKPSASTLQSANAAPRAAEEVLARAAELTPPAAALVLRGWLEASPHDARWSVVAMRLGTLEQDASRHSEALRWFDAVVAVGAPATAVEDAAAHRVLCLVALGRTSEVAAAARDFRARWPASAWSGSLPKDVPAVP